MTNENPDDDSEKSDPFFRMRPVTIGLAVVTTLLFYSLLVRPIWLPASAYKQWVLLHTPLGMSALDVRDFAEGKGWRVLNYPGDYPIEMIEVHEERPCVNSTEKAAGHLNASATDYGLLFVLYVFWEFDDQHTLVDVCTNWKIAVL